MEMDVSANERLFSSLSRQKQSVGEGERERERERVSLLSF